MSEFDVIVVGAGHAGIEAALAAARMGLRTACVTMRLDRIGHLPCNCSIGGPAKGHMAREVDALGGQMAITTDYAVTHIRRVGTGKGPAVQTVRAHVCKTLYPRLMQETFARQPNLTVIQGLVLHVLADGGKVSGVALGDGQTLRARSVVLTTGTFLNGLCHEGRKKTQAAREGDLPSVDLSSFLRDLGVRLRRFKTGTTPRIAKSSLRLDTLPFLESEPDAGPVSFLHDRLHPERALLPCWQTRTTPATHDLIRERLHESAMYAGEIEGIGPRYCPSIEDKIVRFADKETHPIFLEQEEWDSESIYVQGVSTSLPAEVQTNLLRTIPGLEAMEMIRPGYAVEYDMADPLQLTPHLMSKLLPGLFLAGQLNGTSGYEEAAGQGIVAGINAARYAQEETPVDFPRDESFIGVMIDDLVTKGVEDPYRMLTARAEHRLLLRHDNADARLTPLGHRIGLVRDDRWSRFEAKRAKIERGLAALETTFVTSAQNEALHAFGSAEIENRLSAYDLMRRPEMTLERVESLLPNLGLPKEPEVREQLALAALYDGYIQKQRRLADRSRKLDELAIPVTLDLANLAGLSYESREKLGRIRPTTVGQASRVPGVRPSDIALLIGHLRK
ncbi:MAG: tRNA uridine-5-carboxymethylaminomethyl(34) synthesis enzyme MnmG [Fimbriimonas sp.]